MIHQNQTTNPGAGAAPGEKEGGPSSWEEELRRVVKAGARQDTLAGASAVINDYIRNSGQVFVPLSNIVGKRYSDAEWLKLEHETTKAWGIVHHDLAGEKMIFLPKSQTQLVEQNGQIIGLLTPGWLLRSHGLLERIVRHFLFTEIEKERERRRR